MSRIDPLAPIELDEMRLVSDGLVDVLERVGLTLHVTDLDMGINQAGCGGPLGTTGQESLVQAAVGGDPRGGFFRQDDAPFEVHV